MFRSSTSLLRLAPRTSPLPSRAVPKLRPAWPIATGPRPVRWGVPVARFASGSGSDDKSKKPSPSPVQSIDREHEKEIGQRILEPRPSEVSSESSVRHVIEGSPTKHDADLGHELKHDLDIIHKTFRLSKVPLEPRVLGLAGTLPYLATSLSTVFLAWDLSKELPTGNALYDAVFVDHETAQYLLSVIEPVQLGYGALIISFLGAAHWGLEYAEKTPLAERTRFRYGVGVAAPLIAWPTLFMPIEYALTTQFMAFVALYFVDSRSAVRGWAPPWYGIYRFLLTAVVGLAILISLVGRAKISTHGRLSSQGLTSSMTSPGIADHETDWVKLEAEEKARIKKEKEQAEKKAKEAEKRAKKKDGKGAEDKDKKGEGKGKKDEDAGQKAGKGNDDKEDDDKSHDKAGGENEAEGDKEHDKGDGKGSKDEDASKSQGPDKGVKDGGKK